MMKKNRLIFLLILTICTAQAKPILYPALSALCSKIAKNSAFRICRRIGYVGALCGIGYSVMRYLNDLRNSSRDSQIKYTQGTRPTLTINTDGLTTITGHDIAQGLSSHTERFDPDTQRHNLFEENRAVAKESRWQKFLQWLVRPPYRAFERTTISVPRNTKITIKTTNAHEIDHPHEQAIDITGIDGEIDASTQSGNVHITDAGGNVTVTTPDHAEILNFGGALRVNGLGTFHATRHERNTEGLVILDDQQLAAQPEYLLYPIQ